MQVLMFRQDTISLLMAIQMQGSKKKRSNSVSYLTSTKLDVTIPPFNAHGRSLADLSEIRNFSLRSDSRSTALKGKFESDDTSNVQLLSSI
jgi:hypothetical protein